MPITQNVEGTPAAGMSAFTVITPAMANKKRAAAAYHAVIQSMLAQLRTVRLSTNGDIGTRKKLMIGIKIRNNSVE